jgi:hypothetical protein
MTASITTGSLPHWQVAADMAPPGLSTTTEAGDDNGAFDDHRAPRTIPTMAIRGREN